jgi:CRP-like cAMP-binding protein
MASNQKINVFNQISIAAQIIDGSIKIDSEAEFENVLRLFPNDPALMRAYADLLVTKNSFEVAATSYGEAASLFIDSGMTLQAIVSKSLEWKVNPPTDPEEIKEFFTLANENGYNQTPVNFFFHALSYSALVAILYPLIKVRLPAGKMVKKVGDEEKSLYLLVSGALRTTTFQPVKSDNEIVYKKSTFHLSENDFFGDVYPFENQELSRAYVETITESELIKIPKINLMKVCVKYPDVEEALANLFTAQSGIEETENSMVQRMGSRQQVPVKVHLQVLSQNMGNLPLSLTGYSRDISIGGICVVLDSEYRDHPSLNEYIKNADVQISLPSEDFTVNVPGKVIWNRQIDLEQDTVIALGMQYREMSPKSQGMLLAFANSLKII